MRHSRLLASALLVLGTLVCSAMPARACSCLPSGPPCQAYSKFPVVFAGTATDVSDEQRLHRLVRFRVDEAFKGVDGAEVEVHTGLGGGDCGYPFTEGTQYLVYASRNEKDGRLAVSICSRTAPLAEASDDIAYIRGLANAATGGTIFGSATRFARNLREGGSTKVGPIAGMKVVATSGNRRVEAVTGEDGRFRFEALSPGTYRVEASVPAGLTPQESQEVRVADRGCAEIVYLACSDGRVSGRLLDSSGNPVRSTTVDLIPVDSLDGDRRGLWEISEEDGRFEIDEVPPGRYVLGVNLARPAEPTDNYPVPRTFFPSGDSPSTAQVIVLGDGQHVSGLELQLPPPLPVRSITGVVVWPDGRPAFRAQVSARDTASRYLEGAAGSANVRGEFTLRVFDGQSVVLEATIAKPPTPGDERERGVRELLRTDPVPITKDAKPGKVRLVIRPE
jgi:hypothetical protein